MESEARRRVLVVDDQDDERAIQRAMLSHLGYDVREAHDGARALELCAQEVPDAVLLDVAMPRMDGVEVCRRLRADPRTAAVKVLLFTASVAGDLDQTRDSAGADHILAKPVDPRRVAETIARLLEDGAA